mgnify:CR=1 FL=1
MGMPRSTTARPAVTVLEETSGAAPAEFVTRLAATLGYAGIELRGVVEAA